MQSWSWWKPAWFSRKCLLRIRDNQCGIIIVNSLDATLTKLSPLWVSQVDLLSFLRIRKIKDYRQPLGNSFFAKVDSRSFVDFNLTSSLSFLKNDGDISLSLAASCLFRKPFSLNVLILVRVPVSICIGSLEGASGMSIVTVDQLSCPLKCFVQSSNSKFWDWINVSSDSVLTSLKITFRAPAFLISRQVY